MGYNTMLPSSTKKIKAHGQAEFRFSWNVSDIKARITMRKDVCAKIQLTIIKYECGRISKDLAF